VLTARDIRLVDVSPGPMLFDELAGALEFQRRVSLSARAYVERLDDFVALYEKGASEHVLATRARHTHVIPRAVPLPPRFVPLPPADALLPQRFDPEFAIGTCCRVVPDKRVEFLFDMMRILSKQLPQVSLTIVGGPDSKSLEYWEALLHRAHDERLDNVRFVGRHDDVNPFLAQFKVFVMVSDRQGSPNASLEAMAMRLPLVANPDGGTAEQIADGVNGFLAEDPAQMAERVARLLRDPALRRSMGEEAYKTVIRRFPIDEMVRKYNALFSGEDFAEEPELM
jgi:glycosyltransferase involved in cell wall biosynthesis